MRSGFYVVLISLLSVLLPLNAYSQIVEASGNTSKSASQLIYWYDLDFGTFANNIQVTNTNDTAGVWVHVQIFRNFDSDPSESVTPVLCDERNFVDFLTPNDTHLYALGQTNFTKNMGEAEGQEGESTTLELNDPPTKGFVVITPVVSESDLTAISFQDLIGISVISNGVNAFTVNAMGRDAVDFTSGEVLPNGTPLDGSSNGFVVLQPSELVFDFSITDSSSAFIVGISFTDEYGEGGLLGYTVNPGTTSWDSFVFDWKEDPTSCGTRENQCFFSIGLNDNIEDANELLNDSDLCEGTGFGEDTYFQGGVFGPTISGWTRIFVNQYDDMENQLGLVGFIPGQSPEAGADWMYTNE